LVDWTGRILREDKRGAIDGQLPPVLQRLGIQSENWIDSASYFHKYFFDAAGTLSSLEQFREKKNRQQSEKGNAEESVAWIKGKGGFEEAVRLGSVVLSRAKSQITCLWCDVFFGFF